MTYPQYPSDVRPMERLPKASYGPVDAPKAGWRYPYHTDAFQISYKPVNAGIFNMYLYDEIESPEQFIPAIEALDNAGENDYFRIYLQTPGGSMDAADAFIDALKKTQARVVAFASGGVHSAGTIILLNVDEFYLSENFNALVHNASYGMGGKASDVRTQFRYTDKHIDTVLRDTYAGFLDDEELDALLEGKDFWFNAEQFGERYERRNEFLGTRMAIQQAIADIEAEEADDEPMPAGFQPRVRKKKVVAKHVQD